MYLHVANGLFTLFEGRCWLVQIGSLLEDDSYSYPLYFFLSLFFTGVREGLEGGGPDPAFPPLFHANPASRTFFISFRNPVFPSQENTLKV